MIGNFGNEELCACINNSLIGPITVMLLTEGVAHRHTLSAQCSFFSKQGKNIISIMVKQNGENLTKAQ